MIDYSCLCGKTVLVTGGSGMIGKAMIDMMLRKADCRIVVTGRDKVKVHERLGGHVTFLKWDISREHFPGISGPVDYIIHLASNTHPIAYVTDPVGTIVMNVSAAKELLDLAVEKGCRRFVYASSVEIYGQNRGDVDSFDEGYCGYIDPNTLRAGYPESKRCGETLCQAYIRKHHLDVVIPRIARVYGPTLLKSDTKAMSQFLFNALSGKDIVLKSEGKQFFSYLHVDDAVDGILTVFLNGECGEAYNIADEKSDVMLRNIAEHIAKICGCKVLYEIPNETEAAGFSPVMRACMNGDKLKRLGWKAKYDIYSGLEQTIREMQKLWRE